MAYADTAVGDVVPAKSNDLSKTQETFSAAHRSPQPTHPLIKDVAKMSFLLRSIRDPLLHHRWRDNVNPIGHGH